MPRAQVTQEVEFILSFLDNAAQRSTASPSMSQGELGRTVRTATEVSATTAGVDKRFGLAAKIFGWSEKRFWQQWYCLYREHFSPKID